MEKDSTFILTFLRADEVASLASVYFFAILIKSLSGSNKLNIFLSILY